MRILNLKADFAPLGAGEPLLEYSKIFAGGEINVRLKATVPEVLTVTTRLQSSDDIMELFMVTNALRAAGAKDIHVFFPYLPYARQDRIVRPGEAFALRQFADLINQQEFASVGFFDAHSDVGPALIRRAVSHSPAELVRKVCQQHPGALLVSPDAGAYKKVSQYAAELQLSELPAVATKVRAADGSVTTGQLSPANYTERTALIIDDICDGGRTFAALAPVLRSYGVARVILVVSHGIFSYGEQPLRDGGIDHVYTTDSITGVGSDFITRVPLASLLAHTNQL